MPRQGKDREIEHEHENETRTSDNPAGAALRPHGRRQRDLGLVLVVVLVLVLVLPLPSRGMLTPRSLASLALVLSVSACSSPNDTSNLPDPEPLTTAPPPPTAQPTSEPVAANVEPKPESPFVAVAKLDGVFSLFPVDNALVVAGQESKRFGDKGGPVGNWFGVVEGDNVKFTKEWVMQGWFHNVVAAAGKWPDDMTILAVGDSGRAPTAERFTIANGEMMEFSNCKTEGCNGAQRFVGLLKTKSSLAGMNAPFMPFAGTSFVTTFNGPQLKLKPKAPGADCKKDDGMGYKTMVFHNAATALTDGSVVAYGSTCNEGFAIETWKAGESTSSVTMLETAGLSPSDAGARFLLSSTGDTWLVDGFLFHLENGAWNRLETPGAGDAATRGAIAKDGTLWLTTTNGLFRREKDRWAEVELPNDAKAEDVAVDHTGVVWVIAGGTLMRERKSADAGTNVAVVPTSAPPAKAKQPPTMGGPKCKDNLVILYGFTKVTPDDYDFPLTRKALKGHGEFTGAQFVVTKDGGKKFFAAKTPTFAMAKKLVAVIEKGVDNAKPAIVCAQPEVVREVRINLTTGDVIK